MYIHMWLVALPAKVLHRNSLKHTDALNFFVKPLYIITISSRIFYKNISLTVFDVTCGYKARFAYKAIAHRNTLKYIDT